MYKRQIVDIDPEEAIRRTNDSAPDRIESAGIGFQEKIRKQYKELIKLFHDRCMSIDGSSSPVVINRSVWDEIKNRKFIYEK